MARQLPTEEAATEEVVQDVAAQVARSGRVIPIAPPRQQKEVRPELLVPSGATMLNLACSDTIEGAYLLGGFSTLPGASSAGKTVLALTTFAECTYLPRLNDYLLIHDDAEERMAFDMEYLFSKRVADRICCPPLGNSKTIQQFKANMLHLQKEKRKVIYVLDSFDSLASDEELEKEMKKAMAMAKSDKAAKEIAGSYGMEKAKIAGQILRMANNYLEESQSLVLMTQQLRENVGGGMFDPEFITSGGQAPFFYSNHQVWLTKGAAHKKTKSDRDIVIGHHVRAKVVKNSATGKMRNVEWDYFYDMGIDDVGSVVDWMCDWGYWKERTIQGTKGIACPELDLFLPTRNKIIAAIEDKNLERPMREAVGAAWKKLEDSLKLGRKHRYE